MSRIFDRIIDWVSAGENEGEGWMVILLAYAILFGVMMLTQ
jgi:hypothetical protein